MPSNGYPVHSTRVIGPGVQISGRCVGFSRGTVHPNRIGKVGCEGSVLHIDLFVIHHSRVHAEYLIRIPVAPGIDGIAANIGHRVSRPTPGVISGPSSTSQERHLARWRLPGADRVGRRCGRATANTLNGAEVG